MQGALKRIINTLIGAHQYVGGAQAESEMKYRTTRGGIKGATFQQALLSGYAPDGGLFVPENLPSFTREEIRSWVGLSYPQLLEKFVRIFISPEELSSQEIHGAFLL